jgi:RHS repeat-associated protein
VNGDLIHNRLYHVNDPMSGALQSDDIDDEGAFNPNLNLINSNNNYNYDEIGNLVKDSTEEIDTIKWTVYGKIKEIIRKAGSTKDNLVFDYDASGNRISKRVLDNSNNWKYTTFYVRDAQGNVMSTYDQKVVSMAMTFKLKEQDIFGSSRIGLNLPEKEIIGATSSALTYHVLGKRQYELSNHLGNVLSIITDRKIPVEDSGSPGTIEYSIADVASAQDYSAFGVKLYGRGFEFSGYRYGFNGKENDNEAKGEGNQQDYGMRIYDPRLGRFLSVDPLGSRYPGLTTYQFSSNRPIDGIDLDGLERLPFMLSPPSSMTISTGETFIDELVYAPTVFASSFVAGVTYGWGGDQGQVNLSIYGFSISNGGFYKVGDKAPGAGQYDSPMKFNDGMRLIGGTLSYISIGELVNEFSSAKSIFRAGGKKAVTGPLATVPDFESKADAFLSYAKHVKGAEYNFKTKSWKALARGADMPKMSFDDYVSQGRALMSSTGKDVMQFNSAEGSVFKFNKKTGYFAVADKEGNITTFFKPDKGEAYFKEQVAKYGKKKE